MFRGSKDLMRKLIIQIGKYNLDFKLKYNPKNIVICLERL